MEKKREKSERNIVGTTKKIIETLSLKKERWRKREPERWRKEKKREREKREKQL